ncbi:MAG: CoA transferase, partial [Chloroflexi bacterium]|nr:CoA transferase [Chloroflexota bacterium]
MAERALEDFRVLELADSKGSYCGRLLADLGVELIKIEPPGGDQSRWIGPFAGDTPHPEASLSFLYYNTSKKSVTIDMQSPGGRRQFKALLRTADALLETLPPGTLSAMGFGPRVLARLNPRLVIASVTGFGQTGPYKDYQAPDIVNCAMGGLMAMCGAPERPPMAPPSTQAHQAASVHAAYAILLALYNRMITGKGAHIDISAHEIQAAQQYNVVNYSSSEHIPHRNRRRTGAAAGPVGIYPCKDGYVHFFILAPAHWRAFYDWMGRPDALSDPIWENRHFRAVNHDVLEPFVLAFAAEHTKEELYRQGQSRHLPVSPINTIEDFANDIHNKARGFFVEMAHPQVGAFLSPGSPYRFSEPMWEIQRSSPLLGQHNTEILVRERTEPSRSTQVSDPSRPL